MKLAILYILLSIAFVLGCSEDTPPETESITDTVIEIDNFGVRPALYFSVSDTTGSDIFQKDSYSIDELVILTKVPNPNGGYVKMDSRHIHRSVLGDKTIIGTDGIYVLEELIFDYGNQAYDTIAIENGELLRHFRLVHELPEFNGTMKIIFNSQLAESFVFAPGNDAIRMFFERNVIRSVGEISIDPPIDPYIIALTR